MISYADYIVFGFLLLMSACIGFYFSIFGGKQKTNDDYLLAGKNMSIFPTSFSLMATFISVSTIIGIPADIYLFGTNMAFINIGFILGPIIASAFFLPIYFNIGISTAFEYLEKRFGKTTRRILSLIYLVDGVLFSGLSLYAPALALSAVTDLSMWVSVSSISAVAIFYSTIGGMKAVIWTDMFQGMLMFTCLLSIIIKGCLDLGGIQAILKTAYDGKRIIVPMLSMDFSERYTLWSIILQGMIISTACFASHQVQVQRQLTLRNLKRSVIASLLSIPMIVSFQILCCLCGIIFYVYFQACDPVTSQNHPIESYDQLMPYYIISAMKEYPGLPGLCITGIFSVSLSAISAMMNSLAAVTYQDIVKPIFTNIEKEVLITKIANLFFGILSIFVALLVETLGNIMQAIILIIGMVGGPELGVFFLASFTTTANEMGTNIGVLSGFFLALFLTFFPSNRNYPTLPVEISCSANVIHIGKRPTINKNVSLHESNSNIFQINSTSHKQPNNFPVSFMWISPLSMLVCILIGYFSSWIISFARGKNEHVPPELLNPLRQRFCVKQSLHSKEMPKEIVPENNNSNYKSTQCKESAL